MSTTIEPAAEPAMDPSGRAVVDIWWWLTSAPARIDAPATLSPAELAAAARLPRHHAKEYVVYRTVLRRILGELLDVTPASVVFGRRPCPECGDLEHGPPLVSHPVNPLWISISHTRGCAMLAVAPHEIGVDVEKQRPIWSADLAARAPVVQLSGRVLPQAEPYITARPGQDNEAIGTTMGTMALKAVDESRAKGVKFRGPKGKPNLLEITYPSGYEAGVVRHNAFFDRVGDAFNLLSTENAKSPDAQGGFTAARRHRVVL